MRLFGLLLALVALAAVPASQAAPASTKPVPVLTTPWVDILPAASEDYLAYSQLDAKSKGLFNAWVQPTAGPRFRVNAPGTTAFVGAIDGTTLVFEERTPTGMGQLRLADLDTKTVTSPAGVNTGLHESNPGLSGDYIVFTRSVRKAISAPRRLILRNLDTSEQTIIDIGKNAYVQTGGIAGDYVVWTRCPRFDRCRTWLYDIAAETKQRLPNPGLKSQYAATVMADGTVFYAESGSILCGPRKVVRIWMKPLGQPRVLIWKLAAGRDPSHMTTADVGGTVELYFDRFDCRTGKTRILKSVLPVP